MTEYRWAERSDWKAILEAANHAFAPDEHTGDFDEDSSEESYFPRILPKIYQNEETAPLHYLAVDEGRVIGMVASFPTTTVVAGERLSVIGIGTVSTVPDRRSEGNMKRLMNDSLEAAKARGADYLVLGGQRQRYENWGFGKAGMNLSHDFTRANAEHVFGEGADFGFEFRPLDETESGFIEAERRLRESAGIYVVREPRLEWKALCSMHHKPFVILKDGEFAGTFMMNVKRCKSGRLVIDDLRLEEPRLVLEIANDMLARRSDVRDLVIAHTAPDAKTFNSLLGGACEETRISNDESIKILNYNNTIYAYLKYLVSYRRVADGSFTASFPNGERLRIGVAGGEAFAESLPDGAPADVRFSELGAVNALFGNAAAFTDFGCGLPGAAAGWLPLPFFMYASDET